jgi:membrane protein YqaA with SNARE-associated domain
MRGFIEWLQAFAAAIGGPGLFIIAFLDSSFVPLPQVNDLLIISAVMEHPSALGYYAVMATAGSLAGCLVLYEIGRRGGAGFVERRFGGRRLTNATRTLQRHGVVAVLVASLLPPPAPFKLFVLLAGVTRIPRWRFSLALVLGRGGRFLALGLLAAYYGERALGFVEQHQRTVGLGLVAFLLVAGGLWVLWGRRRQPSL